MLTIDNDFGDGICWSWRRLDFADNSVLITQWTAALIFFRLTEMCFIKQMLRTTDMPGQTVQTQIKLSGSTLFAILSASFGLITLWQSHIVQILEWLQILGCPNI